MQAQHSLTLLIFFFFLMMNIDVLRVTVLMYAYRASTIEVFNNIVVKLISTLLFDAIE